MFRPFMEIAEESPVSMFRRLSESQSPSKASLDSDMNRKNVPVPNLKGILAT
jgi:hypothetical protein